MNYYILIENKTAGPYTLEQVKALHDSGIIESGHSGHLYATTESEDWVPVSMLVPLFNIKNTTKIPPVVPQPSVVINNINNNGKVGYPVYKIVIPNQKSRIGYKLLALFFLLCWFMAAVIYDSKK